jgi:beta-lactamase superfamily II metal-dependent hydrolase
MQADPALTDSSVEIHFVDVGQGDSTIIIDRSEMIAFVIDCPAGAQHVVETRLRNLGAPNVHGVMITHWDLDHYGGALELAAATRCKELYFNRETMMAFPTDRTLRRAALRRTLEEPYRSMQRRYSAEGAKGRMGNFDWVILAPSDLQLTEAVVELDRNLASIVLRGTAHGVGVIVSGDADGRVWQRLLDDEADLSSDILRWPHHGSPLRGKAGVRPKDILGAVNPEFVAISVGTSNRYNHPDFATVQAISARCRMACTEITKKCHPAVDNQAVPCGGHLSFVLLPGAVIRPEEGWTELDSVIDGWSSPMCRSPGLDDWTKGQT